MDLAQHDLLGSGVRIRVAECGPLSGPAVVLVHGAFVDSRTWHGLLDQLGQEFRMFSPDLPGFGDSEKPAPSRFPYTVEAFTESLVDLYGALGLSRASVVGHGLGGAIAMTLAARHPELVARLVLIDPICRPPPAGSLQRTLLLPVLGGLFLKQLLGRHGYRVLFRDWLVGPGANVDRDRIDAYYETLSSPTGRASLLATLRATVDTRPIVAQTVRIGAPTLVVWGRHDRLQSATLGQRLAREIRGAGFELLDSGHSPQEEVPVALANVVRRFLRAERSASA